MRERPTPLDATIHKVASSKVGHRRTVLQEGETAGLEVALSHQTVSHGFLSITQITIFKTASVSNTCSKAVFKAYIVETTVLRKVDLANFGWKFHLQKFTRLEAVYAAQVEQHPLERE